MKPKQVSPLKMKPNHDHDYVLDLSEEAKSDLKDIPVPPVKEVNSLVKIY